MLGFLSAKTDHIFADPSNILLAKLLVSAMQNHHTNLTIKMRVNHESF